MQRRHIAGLVPYQNAVWALRITGADLRRRLEKAAEVFAPLGSATGPLLDPCRPPFHCDTIYGVTYAIDPHRPRGARITALSWQGVLSSRTNGFYWQPTSFAQRAAADLTVHPSQMSPCAAPAPDRGADRRPRAEPRPPMVQRSPMALRCDRSASGPLYLTGRAALS
ncbi:5'-nucleotidase C-terminal domain-containing protein [Sulfitobacter profundi]|uniref:5'-nucleotidase C-terminal domain-containing protein n=1 Tax=Sulfitobacter profundi TaxID=2679961 RepID=A0ABW1YXY4_9RHOB